jgi:hypothetical protein
MVSSNVLSLNTAYLEAGIATGDWYHGAYFLQFGMLQLAMDCDASSFLNVIQSSSPTENYLESFLRIPSHYFIETRDWTGAANFDLISFYPFVSQDVWNANPWTLIYSNFVAVVGKAVLNRPVEEIRASNSALKNASSYLKDDPDWEKYQLPYWRNQFDLMVQVIQCLSVFMIRV